MDKRLQRQAWMYTANKDQSESALSVNARMQWVSISASNVPYATQLINQPTHHSHSTARDEKLLFKVTKSLSKGLQVNQTAPQRIKGLFKDTSTDGKEDPRVRIG